MGSNPREHAYSQNVLGWNLHFLCGLLFLSQMLTFCLSVFHFLISTPCFKLTLILLVFSWTDTTVQSRCRKHRHHQSFEPLDVFLLFLLHINHWNGETGEMLEVGEAGRGRLEVCVPGHNPSVWNDSTGKHPYSTSSAPLNIHGWFLRGQCVCVRLRVCECVFVSV